MEKEFNLSKKIDDRNERLLVRHVKEFIKRLKKRFYDCTLEKKYSYDKRNICEQIDELAGDELI